MTDRPTTASTAPPEPSTARLRACFVAPRHPADPQWKWVTEIGSMQGFGFDRIYVDHEFPPAPRLIRLYQKWQYSRAASEVGKCDLAYLFSPDIGIGLTGWPAAGRRMPPRIYVGFTQDGPWPQGRIRRLRRALGRFDAVTVFTEEERQCYVPRYRLDPGSVHVIPIHTDETDSYRQYPDTSPEPKPYVLSMGSPNRRFLPVARACKALGVPLIIITRPWHQLDDLNELRELGATLITDADKMRALTYLKHATATVMAFDDPTIAGGFTTLIHAMFMQTPLVVSECLGMTEHVINGKTGYVTPHRDEDALATAIDRIWSDTSLARQFGEAARERAQARHSLEAAAESFANLGQAVTAGQKNPGQPPI